MFALGTFNAQKAVADKHGDVMLEIDATEPNAAATVTVEFTSDEDIKIDGNAITIELVGIAEMGDIAVENVLIGATVAGNPESPVTTDKATYFRPGAVEFNEATDDAANIVIGLPTTNVQLRNASGDLVDADGDEVETALDYAYTGIESENKVTVTISPISPSADVTNGLGTSAAAMAAYVSVTVKVADDTNEPDDVGTALDDYSLGESNKVGVGVVLDTDTTSAAAGSFVSVEVGTGDPGVYVPATGFPNDIDSGDRITVDMGTFGLPDSIGTDDVSIRGLDSSGDQEQRGEPESVRISGSQVTLIVPDMNGEEAGGPRSFRTLQDRVQHGSRHHDPVDRWGPHG